MPRISRVASCLLLLASFTVAMSAPPARAFDLDSIAIGTMERRVDGGPSMGFFFEMEIIESDGELTAAMAISLDSLELIFFQEVDNGEVSAKFHATAGPFTTLAELRQSFPEGQYGISMNDGAAIGALTYSSGVPDGFIAFALPQNGATVLGTNPSYTIFNGCTTCNFLQMHLDSVPVVPGTTKTASIPLGETTFSFNEGLQPGDYEVEAQAFVSSEVPASFGPDAFSYITAFGSMNTIEFTLMPIPPRAFYVDATAGDDANDGLSSATAWQTLTRVNSESLVAGDSVLLKRGETWLGEALLLHEPGLPGEKIRVGAYGSGAKPKIRPHEVYDSGWVPDTGNVYRQATSRPVSGDAFLGAVWEDVSRMDFVASPAGLDAPGKAAWQAGTLYIWPSDSGDPNINGMTYRVAHETAPGGTNLGVDMRSDYLIVEDLDIAWVGHYGIGQQYQNSNNNDYNEIRRNTVSHSFHDLIAFGGVGQVVENNEVTNAQDFGIATLDVGEFFVTDGLVSGNIVSGALIGLTPEGSVDDILWVGNVVTGCQRAIGAVSDVGAGQEFVPTRQVFRDNVLVWNEIGIQLSGSGANFGAGSVFEGNLIAFHSVAGVVSYPGGVGSGLVVRDNQIVGTQQSGIFLLGANDQLELSYNVIQHAGIAGYGGIHIAGAATNALIVNNTIHDSNAGIILNGTGGGHELRNNIVTDSATYDLFVVDYLSIAGSSHNLYFGGADGVNGMSVNGIGTISLPILQGVGLEIDSIQQDPRYVDPQNYRLQLQIDSPAIDSGIDVGLDQDLEGNAPSDVPGVPNTGNPGAFGLDYLDRGAYEYVP